jgi:antitoxin (DNA-binding transcriptional repressor) of toxin-antitoxin stability system
VARIERAIKTQLVRRGVSAEIPREGSTLAPVIPIAPAFRRKPQGVRTFAPRRRRM